MQYIKPTPNPSGAYPPPQSNPAPGLVAIPEELAFEMAAHYGFIIPVIEDGAVVSQTINVEAMEAWKAEQPEPEEPTTEPSVWDELDAAYQEGVNAAYDE